MEKLTTTSDTNHKLVLPETRLLIGVLCVDVAYQLNKIYGKQVKSYIAASYVKWLEGAGGRVVPIWIGRPRIYYEDIMRKISGILIPGGAVFFDAKYYVTSSPELRNDCVQSSKFIYELAVQQNGAGEYFPIWGTCLGMELLLLHSADGMDPRQDCEHMDCGLPVQFTEDFRKSKLFSGLSPELEHIMQSEPFAYHFHRYCVTEADLLQSKINNDWHVLATNKDAKGLKFISILEHKIYPFYGAQFHPERVRYEQLDGRTNDGCSHSSEAIKAAQYLAEFFVNECRRSSHHFASHDEELAHLIWNFEVTFTGRHNTHWMQCYLFQDAPEYIRD